MRAPDFWTRNGWAARLLAPAGCLYAGIGARRRRGVRPFRAGLPVICIGNIVAGGAGKTPLALALGRHLRARGHRPAFLSRGYGGRLAGPLRVDPALHAAGDVGDEPLLLAAEGPAWIARDRAEGARAILAAGEADCILMDDGFQNPALAKDLSILAVDGGYGFGNGRAMPAGPLREPLAAGLARAQAVVLIGEDRTGAARRLPPDLPLFHAALQPEAPAVAGRVLAFAGIGRPEKFFETLAATGADIAARVSFPDHHPYSEAEIASLRRRAEELGARLVTTTKDAMRLPPVHRDGIETLAVALRWIGPDAGTDLDRLLNRIFSR